MKKGLGMSIEAALTAVTPERIIMPPMQSLAMEPSTTPGVSAEGVMDGVTTAASGKPVGKGIMYSISTDEDTQIAQVYCYFSLDPQERIAAEAVCEFASLLGSLGAEDKITIYISVSCDQYTAATILSLARSCPAQITIVCGQTADLGATMLLLCGKVRPAFSDSYQICQPMVVSGGAGFDAIVSANASVGTIRAYLDLLVLAGLVTTAEAEEVITKDRNIRIYGDEYLRRIEYYNSTGCQKIAEFFKV